MIADNLVLRPAGRRRDTRISRLKRPDHTNDLVHIPSDFLRIVENSPDTSFSVDHEDRTDCVRPLAGVDEAERLRDRAGISDNWELDIDREILADPFLPLDMRKDLIHGEPDELTAERAKLIEALLERDELGRADRREIRRMRKEHEPLARKRLGKSHLPVRRLHVHRRKHIPE